VEHFIGRPSPDCRDVKVRYGSRYV
jgi:hypothetical protein